MTRREKLLHPATFISLAALFVALGGVGYAATKIGTKQIKNRAVTGKKLANNSVTSPKIKAGAVRNSDLGSNSVSSQKIQSGTIISSDLAIDSVLNGNLGNGAVTSTKIANEAIGTEKLANGSVASDKIGTGAVTESKIGTGAVVASKLGANSVTTPAIAPDSVTAAQIVNGQVVEGNGALSSTNAALTSGQANVLLLDFPGLGVLQADCAAGLATVEFVNASGTSINVRQWGVLGTPDTAVFDSNNPANGGIIQQGSGVNGISGITWMVAFGAGTGLHLATINTSTNNALGNCLVSAQATYTS